MACRTALQMSCPILLGRSEMARASPTPTGLARLNTTVERRKLRVERLDWARLRPRLKAITAL